MPLNSPSIPAAAAPNRRRQSPRSLALQARSRAGAAGSRRARRRPLAALGRRLPAQRQHQHDEADHVGERDMPAVPQPVADRFRLRDTCWTAPRRRWSRTRSSSRRSPRCRRACPSRSRPASAPSAVSGMLSNTAETKPRPKAVCQDADGQFLHRHHRSAGHQREQENACPWSPPAAAPSPAAAPARVSRIATHTATPMNGKAVRRCSVKCAR